MAEEKLHLLSPDAIKEAEALAVIDDGRTIMDALESIGIQEAKFKSGAYFRVGNKDRTIVKKGLMVAETETGFQLRFPKEGVAADSLIVADEFKPTQKMMAAFTGKSQSGVSQTRKQANDVKK